MAEQAVYASGPPPASDAEFADGELRWLVAGNRGRLLDTRRTPITVVEVVPERGAFIVRVEAFEDAGALWDLGLRQVGRFQFSRRSAAADARAVAGLERGLARFDRELAVEVDAAVRRDTAAELEERRRVARAWLREHAVAPPDDVDVLIEQRRGEPALYALCEAFLGERGLDGIEAQLARVFVSHPDSGELVKGHAIVLAELGLCPYRGEAPRDPDLFAGEWTRARRAEHLLWRLAFTRELLTAFGTPELTLYRAAASDEPFRAPRSSSLVSATCSRPVAESHFAGGPATRAAVLWRQRLPLDRVLMTFFETRAMNERFHEAEVVLLGDAQNHAF